MLWTWAWLVGCSQIGNEGDVDGCGAPWSRTLAPDEALGWGDLSVDGVVDALSIDERTGGQWDLRGREIGTDLRITIVPDASSARLAGQRACGTTFHLDGLVALSSDDGWLEEVWPLSLSLEDAYPSQPLRPGFGGAIERGTFDVSSIFDVSPGDEISFFGGIEIAEDGSTGGDLAATLRRPGDASGSPGEPQLSSEAVSWVLFW